MSTTVTYKDETLVTVTNDTATLLTAGKYMEDDVTITDTGGGGGGDLFEIYIKLDQDDHPYIDATLEEIEAAMLGGYVYRSNYATISISQDELWGGYAQIGDIFFVTYYGVYIFLFNESTMQYDRYALYTGVDSDERDVKAYLYECSLIAPSFETITAEYTPSTSEQTDTITYDSSSYNGIDEVTVTINPIPSNYGLITWNGITLTVS